MLVKLSSKGQLVIPKTIRQGLKLEPNALFHVRVSEEGEIILEPIQTTAIAALCGKYPDVDFLTEMETEHQREVDRDSGLRA